MPLTYIKFKFDDDNTGTYETTVTFDVNPQTYEPYSQPKRIATLPLLEGTEIQDSGFYWEGTDIVLANLWIDQTMFESLWKRYSRYVKDYDVASVNGSYEYTLTHSAIRKPIAWKSGAEIDPDNITWSSTTPTKVTINSAGTTQLDIYYYREPQDFIFVDHNAEEFLVAWKSFSAPHRVMPQLSHEWTIVLTVIQKLTGSKVEVNIIGA